MQIPDYLKISTIWGIATLVFLALAFIEATVFHDPMAALHAGTWIIISAATYTIHLELEKKSE